MALDVHVVSHTHWDREWYHPLERFRQRLVELIDELLDDPPDARASFLLDGQAVLLDDYAGVRPERAGELASLLRAGRLEAGPWYVLADELIPSGEALVRNLLAGRRALARLGVAPPSVLYCPDSFGHPAALPDIAAGFGLPVIILSRGYGGPRWPAGDAVRWQGPGGAAALLYHLPRSGYEFGSHLPLDLDGARQRWEHMRAELAPRSSTGVILVPHGADHHARQTRWRDALDAIERAGESDGVHRSSLAAFAARLEQRAASQRLPVVRGELRDSYGYTWALQGTFATRAHEKRLNAHAERALLRDAEPWSALAGRGAGARRPLVEAAWRDLLGAQPHDTLCGCSIDDVAMAMETRLRGVLAQARGLRDDSIAGLLGHDAAAAREARDRWTPVAVVRNSAPRARAGVAIIDVEQFMADVPVGPGSAPVADAAPLPTAEPPRIPSLGRVQVLSAGTRFSRVESPRHYPDNDLVSVHRVAAWVSGVPAYGLTTHAIGQGARPRGGPSGRVVTGPRSLRNAHIAVSVDEHGHVSIEQPATGRVARRAISIVDEADVGDLYTPAPRPRACIVESRGVRRVHAGPLRGELELRYRIRESARARSVDANVTLRLTLDADAPFLRIGVAGENRRGDHRMRLAIRGDVENGAVWADAAFGPVRREPLVVSDAERAVERPQPTAPLHRYVSLFGDRAGMTVFSDGLAEYEARTDGELLVTLVRAVGELSRNDLPERPGHAGWPAPTPAAQCIGPFEAALAVMFHGPRVPAVVDEIECAADDVLLPLAGDTLRAAIDPPASVAGVELAGPGLAFSSIKESEAGGWLVLRCVNLRDDEVRGAWRLPFVPVAARLTRLDETVLSELATSGSDVEFAAPPRAIVTILVR